MRCHSASSSRVASAPATTSEWPLRYLVAECITMSAPSSIGRVSTGVATVESTASRGAGRVRDVGGGGDVGDRPQRIGRRLDPHQPGVARPRARAHCVRIAPCRRTSTRRPHCVAKPASQLRKRPVHDLRHEHMVARRQRLEHGGRRGHARREHQRLRAPPSSAPARPRPGRRSGCRRARRSGPSDTDCPRRERTSSTCGSAGRSPWWPRPPILRLAPRRSRA